MVWKFEVSPNWELSKVSNVTWNTKMSREGGPKAWRSMDPPPDSPNYLSTAWMSPLLFSKGQEFPFWRPGIIRWFFDESTLIFEASVCISFPEHVTWTPVSAGSHWPMLQNEHIITSKYWQLCSHQITNTSPSSPAENPPKLPQNSFVWRQRDEIHKFFLFLTKFLIGSREPSSSATPLGLTAGPHRAGATATRLKLRGIHAPWNFGILGTSPFFPVSPILIWSRIHKEGAFFILDMNFQDVSHHQNNFTSPNLYSRYLSIFKFEQITPFDNCFCSPLSASISSAH